MKGKYITFALLGAFCLMMAPKLNAEVYVAVNGDTPVYSAPYYYSYPTTSVYVGSPYTVGLGWGGGWYGGGWGGHYGWHDHYYYHDHYDHYHDYHHDDHHDWHGGGGHRR